MASSKEYLMYVLEQLEDLDDISYRAMMGEYILYYKGKIIGGIYDDRFLLKPLDVVRQYFPDAELQQPYKGAKEMLAVDVDDRYVLCQLIEAMYPHLNERIRRR